MNPLNKRIYNGESAAFVELYDLYGEKLFRYAASNLDSPTEAADVVQEIFVRMVKSHRKLGKAKQLNAYIFTIARNEIYRWLTAQKKNAAHVSLAGERVDELSGASGHAKSVDSEDWINSVLKFLEPVDREIVQLKVLSDLTFEEIAQILSLQPSNVATKYRRSLLKLESKFKELQPIENENLS